MPFLKYTHKSEMHQCFRCGSTSFNVEIYKLAKEELFSVVIYCNNCGCFIASVETYRPKELDVDYAINTFRKEWEKYNKGRIII
jgi:uncharacterized Zn finger protein